MNTDATARSASLYGARGWTDTTGAAALLAALECGPRLSKDFTRFAGLRAPEALALAQILPEANLHDRQNNGPELAELLDAACRIEGVELSGYLVGPPRWDERVSVDGLFAPPGIGLPDALPEDALSWAKWPSVRDFLGLSTCAAPPDEFLPVPTGHAQGCGWWMWWD